MLDIETFIDGGRVIDTDLFKAENLLSTQTGSLYYLFSFGINLSIFFTQEYNVQLDSFRAYVIDNLVQNGINLAKIASSIDKFLSTMILTIGGNKNGI